MAVINSIETAVSAANGNSYVRAKIDGISYNVFGPLAQKIQQLGVGAQVQITTKQNGKYTNLADVVPMTVGALNPTVNTPTSTGGTGGSSSGSKWVPKDPKELNYMMVTRYALDLMLQGKTTSPADAVKTVLELYKEVAAQTSVSQSRSSSGVTATITKLVNGLGIEESGPIWKQYLLRRYGKLELPSENQVHLLSDLQAVADGAMTMEFLPDGTLNFQKKG